MDAYQQNLKIQRDNFSALETAENRGIAKGKAEGRAEGKAEGIEQERTKSLEEKKELALEMKNDGEPISKILKYTKLSIEEIETL